MEHVAASGTQGVNVCVALKNEPRISEALEPTIAPPPPPSFHPSCARRLPGGPVSSPFHRQGFTAESYRNLAVSSSWRMSMRFWRAAAPLSSEEVDDGWRISGSRGQGMAYSTSSKSRAVVDAPRRANTVACRCLWTMEARAGLTTTVELCPRIRGLRFSPAIVLPALVRFPPLILRSGLRAPPAPAPPDSPLEAGASIRRVRANRFARSYTRSESAFRVAAGELPAPALAQDILYFYSNCYAVFIIFIIIIIIY